MSGVRADLLLLSCSAKRYDRNPERGRVRVRSMTEHGRTAGPSLATMTGELLYVGTFHSRTGVRQNQTQRAQTMPAGCEPLRASAPCAVTGWPSFRLSRQRFA